MLLPQRPYIPIGPLREALAYPSNAAAFPDGELRSALIKVGLGAFADRLDESDNWQMRLSGGVGNYEVRVYARYREAVVQMYEDLFNQHKDPLSDEFQREKRKLEGVERYLIQLWRDS